MRVVFRIARTVTPGGSSWTGELCVLLVAAAEASADGSPSIQQNFAELASVSRISGELATLPP